MNSFIQVFQGLTLNILFLKYSHLYTLANCCISVQHTRLYSLLHYLHTLANSCMSVQHTHKIILYYLYTLANSCISVQHTPTLLHYLYTLANSYISVQHTHNYTPLSIYLGELLFTTILHYLYTLANCCISVQQTHDYLLHYKMWCLSRKSYSYTLHTFVSFLW